MNRVLFVCSMGRLRSKTAHHYYLGLSRFGGLDSDADFKVTLEDVNWADTIICMESRHRSKLRRKFKGQSSKIKVWNIRDEYGYMDSELLLILERRFCMMGAYRKQYLGDF